MNLTKLFLLLFSLKCILNLQEGILEAKNNAKEIKLATIVKYDKKNHLFKFNYKGKASPIFFSFLERPKPYYYYYICLEKVYLTDPNNKRQLMDASPGSFNSKLELNGTYLIEIKCEYLFCELGGKFNLFVPGAYQEIDLNKKMYFNDIEFTSLNYYGLTQLKVSNLREDKYVFFNTKDLFIWCRMCDTYYPGESERNYNQRFFEIINLSNPEKSQRFVGFYKFEKNNEYLINIHPLIKYETDYRYHKNYVEYIYSTFMFFSFTKENIKKINWDSGIISSKGPLFGLINSNQNKSFSILFNRKDKEDFAIGVAETIETIENNFEILGKLHFWIVADNLMKIEKGQKENTIIIAIPLNLKKEIKFFIPDEIEMECKDSYFVPAQKSKLIYCDPKKEKNKLQALNYVLTYKSPYKNLRVNFSDEEATDYIIQNYVGLNVYVDKTKKDCTIVATKYPLKFSFFGAANPYIFNALFNYAKNFMIKKYGYNLKNYEKLSQINIRFNSKLLPFFEFYNFYLNQMNLKLNFYIRQIYGGSELYECNADDFDQKNLISLTNPISNIKCKNKNSIFNRLFSLNGKKIISGYISHDSEFDIYVEIQNDKNTFINLSPIMSENYRSRNNAKYLKKGIKYTINFFLNHLIKLEPGFIAEIVITNGKNTFIINPKKPTVELYGEGYTIKANKDSMIYFFERLPTEIIQKEIDIEKIKGKIINISHSDKSKGNNIIIDFGFKNYYSSNILHNINISNFSFAYHDNLYEKIKVKLVQGEKLYIYSNNKNLNIKYIENNLNYKNNDYKIFLISPNDKNNSIIINFDKKGEINPDIYFCKKNTKLYLSLFSFGKEKNFIFENSDDIPFVLDLYGGGNKLTFKTNKPVIFSYFIHDIIDKNLFYNNSEFAKERKILNDLKIEKIADKNHCSNIIKVKFKANYMKSSTRYIIIIAPKNKDNTPNSFKDACHVVGLLNQKHRDVKVEAIYDAGENELINAEVDISDILNNKNEYIMSIISQELRFDKKIKFYKPKEFIHHAKNPKKDYENSERDTDDSVIPNPKESEDNDDVSLKESEDIEKLESLTTMN